MFEGQTPSGDFKHKQLPKCVNLSKLHVKFMCLWEQMHVFHMEEYRIHHILKKERKKKVPLDTLINK